MNEWKIQDTQTTNLSDFLIDWLPDEAYQYLTPKIIKSRYGKDIVAIEAKSYVGTIPLRNGDTLYILPRAGREAFSRMLLMTEGLDEAIRDEFDEIARLSTDSDNKNDWIKLLARPFMRRIRFIRKQSLMSQRENRLSQFNSIKGKVIIPKTLLNLAQKNDRPISSNYRQKDYASLENRALGTAIAILLSQQLIEDEDLPLAMQWLDMIDHRFVTNNEIQIISKNLRSLRYTGSRSYYISALLMSRILLAHSGVRLTQQEQIEAQPILTDMPLLFERYLRVLIGNILKSKGFVVYKPTQNRRALFLDGTCELEPDILVLKDNQIVLIIDAKYKPRKDIPSSDYYQMFTYLETFNVKTGLLILPSTENTYTHLVRRDLLSGKNIFEIRFQLENWKQGEKYLEDILLNHIF